MSSQAKRNKLQRQARWHKWFAWYPVETDDGKTFFFEFVYRRKNLTEKSVQMNVNTVEIISLNIPVAQGMTIRIPLQWEYLKTEEEAVAHTLKNGPVGFDVDNYYEYVDLNDFVVLKAKFILKRMGHEN